MSTESEGNGLEKTDRETLVRDVAELFNTYVAEGIRVDSFVEKATPSLKIEDLDELLDLYFVLTQGKIETDTGREVNGVLPFVEELPDRIRRLKTTMGRPIEITEDLIRGPVDWRETIAARGKRPGNAERVFAYGEPTKRFDLPENRVLKRLLYVIDEIVEQRIRGIVDSDTDYAWAAPWTDQEQYPHHLRETLDENPYLNQIDEPDERLPFEDIDNVSRARSELYREAATLLQYYRRLQRHDLYPSEARRLLKQFFLTPGPESSSIDSDGTEVLFEFYWAFKLLESVPSPRLELVRQSAQSGVVAKWSTSDDEYTLFHDSHNPAGLRFQTSDRDSRPPETDETNADFFSQKRRFVRTFAPFYDEISRARTADTVNRRPDIVVVRRDLESRELDKVMLGEVKYSKSQKTVREGVEQILETVSGLHVHESGGKEFFASSGELLEDDRIEAALFVDESPYDFDTYPDELTVYEYGDSPKIPF
ncbi:hypothetical protein Hrd1104_00140 [Halorhabdus sp. CBA1104]|uniref:hypothetical protein n=1 Tax=Halorhabdus sp. CBA1104 TaxID=1380432 RepID=UPI0012B3D7FF|nr:hypothetical protein [Halorhabdus sp. CBA1104]QGN05854.1 hypothetical protein Hrd1104_00140 [Halorhabdus sp. CBA1104]